MFGFLLTLQVVSGISLIALVLLHTAKGEGLGGIGGQARLFGSPRGLEEGLDRVTTTNAIIFVGLSVIMFFIARS